MAKSNRIKLDLFGNSTLKESCFVAAVLESSCYLRLHFGSAVASPSNILSSASFRRGLLTLLTVVFLCSCVKNNQNLDYKLAARYNTRLGLAYLSQGNRPLAKTKLLLALKEAPYDPNVHVALAYFFEQTKDFSLAEQYYKNSIKLSSNSGLHCHAYAGFLCRKKQFQKANRYFMLAGNDVNYADTARAFADAGICSLAAGNKQQAAKYFNIAKSRDPKFKIYEEIK